MIVLRKTAGSSIPFCRAAVDKLWKAVPHLLLISGIVFFAFYIYSDAGYYYKLITFSSNFLYCLSFLIIMFLFGSALINFFLYRSLSVSLKFREGLYLALVNILANQLPFSGGLVAKGFYLKQRYKLPYTKYLSATFALHICSISVNGAIGLSLVILMEYLDIAKFPIIIHVSFSIMLLSIFIFWVHIGFLFPTWNKLDYISNKMMDGWKVLRNDTHSFFAVMGIQLILRMLIAARLWVAFRILSQEIAYPQCLLFSAALILTRLVKITPGGIGIREGIVALLASTMGFNAGVGALAVTVDRLVALVLVSFLGIFSSLFFRSDSKSKL
jgi:uncharacterized membrane protein YbhN (UPF0104 family)